MKYQAIKQLKTKSKLLKMCDTFEEAQEVIKAEGAEFVELSYIGQFPTYRNDKHVYQIQGQVEGLGIVCSIPKEELTAIK